MFEQVRDILIANYNQKIAEFEAIKKDVEAVEKVIMDDDSEDRYKAALKELKLRKLKKNSDEYKQELEKIESAYNKSLLVFEANHNKYIELRKKIAKIDIYGYNRKITRVENAKNLEELKIDEEKAAKIISGELEDF